MKVLWSILKFALNVAPVYQITASLLLDLLKKLKDKKKWMVTAAVVAKCLRYVGEQLTLAGDFLEGYLLGTKGKDELADNIREVVEEATQLREAILKKYESQDSAREEKARLVQLEIDKAAEFAEARKLMKPLKDIEESAA